jgi:hypothetical protein
MTTKLETLTKAEENLTFFINELNQHRFSGEQTFERCMKDIKRARIRFEIARQEWLGSLGE